MEIFNKLVEQIGNPLIFVGTGLLVGKAVFSEKKMMNGLAWLLSGAVVYYVINNLQTVMTSLSGIGQAIVNFFSGLF